MYFGSFCLGALNTKNNLASASHLLVPLSNLKLCHYTKNAGVAAHVNAAKKVTSLTDEIRHDRIQVDF